MHKIRNPIIAREQTVGVLLEELTSFKQTTFALSSFVCQRKIRQQYVVNICLLHKSSFFLRGGGWGGSHHLTVPRKHNWNCSLALFYRGYYMIRQTDMHLLLRDSIDWPFPFTEYNIKWVVYSMYPLRYDAILVLFFVASSVGGGSRWLSCRWRLKGLRPLAGWS